MTLINITRSALKSQAVRSTLGERVFDLFGELNAKPDKDEDGNIIDWVIGAGKRLTGFVLGGVKSWLSSIVGGLGSFVRWALTGVVRLASFNWNAADAEIGRMMHANNLAMAAALGDLVGGGAVWLATIGIAGVAALKFPVLGGKIALELAEEGAEEIRAKVINCVNQAGNSLSQNALLWTYLQGRRAWRKALGMPPEVKEGAEPWILSEKIEQWIESIPDDLIRTFVDSAVESAAEAILEAGFVISYAIDDYYASAKLAQEAQFGEERTLKVTPDKRVDQEFITLTGPQTLIQQNVQTALTTHRWIHNRDVGHIVGQPAEDWLRAGMQRRKLTIVFKSKAEPPWSGGTERVKEVSYTIPEPDTGLTWQRIKTAAKPFNWGKYRATANLDNGRQMAVYGATPVDAEDKLKELLPLSTGQLLTLSVSEEKDRHVNLKKEVTRMYPAYATLLIRRSTAELTGTNDLSGNNYKEDHIRIELWPDTEPEGIPPLL
jgi:hypothetical protein